MTSRPGLLDVILPEWQRFPLVIMEGFNAANFGELKNTEFLVNDVAMHLSICPLFKFRMASKDWYSLANVEPMTRAMETKMATILQPFMIPTPGDEAAWEESLAACDYYNNFIPKGSNCMQPLSTIFYPVFETSKQSIKLDESDSYPNGVDVKGIIALDVYWYKLFEDILPSGSKGIMLVVENTCLEDAFTYRVDGPVPSYIGVGDHHDPKYQTMSFSSALFDLASYQIGISDYTGLPVDQDNCIFTFNIYASDEMLNRKCCLSCLETTAYRSLTHWKVFSSFTCL
jgi:hypothetical protein